MRASLDELTLCQMKKLYSGKYGLVRNIGFFDGFSQLDVCTAQHKYNLGDIVPMCYMSVSDAKGLIKGGAASMNPARCKIKSYGEFIERYCACYFKSNDKAEENLVTNSLSTGLACGVDFCHASLSGLLEAAERDSFMLTWLYRVPGNRVVFDGYRNPDLKKLHNHINKHLVGENRLYIYDISKTAGIYTMLTFIKNDLPSAYGLIVSAASHLDPEIALLKSLEELCQGQRYAYQKLYEDKSNIRNIKVEEIDSVIKHFLYYSNSKHNKNIDFIFANQNETAVLSGMQNYSSGCHKNDYENLIENFKAKDIHPLIIDITHPDIKAIGFCAVKCCIPGYIDLMPNAFFEEEKNKRLQDTD